MSSNINVVVLTPNGRRQNVKVTPNTTILQILEDVCAKHNFKPEEYDLKHHNTVLDPTSIMRFSGLPNNALLEMQTATKSRTESDVVVGIQLENGTRLTSEFKPNETIICVLEKLCPSEARLETNPVVIYMRKEIFGEFLQTTTLKSLGITNGRAMLRLLHRSPEELQVQANVSKPLPSKPVEEKPYVRTFKPVDKPTIKDHQDTPKDMHAIQKNKPENKSEERKQGPTPLKSPEVKKKDLVELIKKEKRKRSDASPPPIHTNKAEAMEVDKPPVTEQEEQMDIVRDDVNLSHKDNIEAEFVFLGERNAMVFSLETAEHVRSDDLPDDFFELTIDDAKKLLRDIKQRRFEMENKLLTTSTMRQLEESKKQLRQINRYKKSIIRVQFPDRTVLQGTFLPSDTIETVSDFVKEYLENKSVNFYLYMTPPKTVLDKDSRLIEIGCVPGALLHFGCSNDMIKNYLRKDLIGKFTSNSIASLAAMKMRKQATRPITVSLETPIGALDDDVNVGASTSKEKESTYEDYSVKTVAKSNEKVPKWFKPSK